MVKLIKFKEKKMKVLWWELWQTQSKRGNKNNLAKV